VLPIAFYVHPKFENRLGYLNELAKEDLNPELGQRDREDLKAEIVGSLRRYARQSGTCVESELEIYGMALQKQERMQHLYSELHAIDHPLEERERDPQSLQVRFENGHYMTTMDGTPCELTEGEVITAGEWGYILHLDSSVPRAVRKRHVVESAKREIRTYVDEQIYLEEVNSNRNRTYVTEAYSNLLQERDENLERKGKIAEKVIATFFERLQYDTELDFTLEPADIYQDVIQKVDFIVKKRRHERGVQVEEGGAAGIQFTINNTPEVLAKKIAQINRAKSYLHEEDTIQDILLVSLSSDASSEIWSAYQQWKENGQPIAVDHYLPEETKELLFRNILKDIFTEEEIHEQWSTVKNKVSH
jgi:hypothetical protein